MQALGKYIVIEGADGTGKSTQLDLAKEYLHAQGINIIQVQEPGGAPLADELGHIIKNGSIARDPWTNVLLFTAARRATWLQTILPALDAGIWVLASRSYISTIVYQGYGEGIQPHVIKDFTRTNVSPRYMEPDCALILALSDRTSRKARITSRSTHHQHDTFESKTDAFQRAVEDGYQRYAEETGIAIIRADGAIHDVAQAIRLHIDKLL